MQKKHLVSTGLSSYPPARNMELDQVDFKPCVKSDEATLKIRVMQMAMIWPNWKFEINIFKLY